MKVDKDDFSFMTVYVWSMEVVVSFSFTTDVCDKAVSEKYSESKNWNPCTSDSQPPFCSENIL